MLIIAQYLKVSPQPLHFGTIYVRSIFKAILCITIETILFIVKYGNKVLVLLPRLQSLNQISPKKQEDILKFDI